MKKVLSLILVFVICLVLCACGTKNTEQATNEAVTEYNSSEGTAIDTVVALADADVGNIVVFGTYEQDAVTENGAEPIEWIVFEKSGNNLLLISKYGLDCQHYHASGKDVTWETSTLRMWLNDHFYNTAFPENEQTVILETEVAPDKNPEYDTNPGNATTDKIFILSMSEAKKYMPTESSRICWPTAYAEKMGAFASLDKDPAKTGCCSWWTRTPAWYQNRAVYVLGDYFMNSGMEGNDTNMRPAVRPVLWISVE